jgi:CDP-6-deoxy-D-xylo-4-hexulose-3-dehydrase
MVSFKSQKIGLKMSSVHRSGKPIYPLASDNWDHKEFEAIQQVIDSNHFTMGEQVRIFEESVAKKFGSKFAVMVNSGSSANLIMLTILKILFNQKIKKPNIHLLIIWTWN